MKYISFVIAVLTATLFFSCSKNTEPENQEVRESLYGEWTWARYATSIYEHAEHLDWYISPLDTVKGYYKTSFGRENEYTLTIKTSDTATVQSIEGVYFVTGQGDSLITSYNDIDPMTLNHVNYNSRLHIHSLREDTLVLKAARVDTSNVWWYSYNMFIKNKK
jgi:hypothetical protein